MLIFNFSCNREVAAIDSEISNQRPGNGEDPPPSLKFECPAGYVIAPNSINSIKQFCVATHEMKLSAKGFAVSKDDDPPIVNLTAKEAKDKCLELNKHLPSTTGHYDLISNQEWLQLAHDIESVNENWSKNAVGKGCIMIGNNGNLTDCSYNYQNVDFGSNRDTKSSHKLSNGELIWDFAANLVEYIDWFPGGNIDFLQSCTGVFELYSLNCKPLGSTALYLPKNPANISHNNYNSNMGLGVFYGNNLPSQAPARGGHYNYGKKSGIFMLSLVLSKSSKSKFVGFRCVFREK